MADSSTSSTSQSHSEKKQMFHFRASFDTEDIQLVAKIRKFHQHNIELSIKNLQRKQSYNTQVPLGVTILVVLVLLQTKDLKCATHLLSDKFRNMSEEKKMIVRNLGFGGLMHIPPLRVHHQVLRELANNFKLGENRLETGYGDLFPQKVDYKKLSEDDKEIFRRFQGKTLKSLTDEMMDIGVGNEEDRLITQSKKKKVVVEHSSPEEDQSYDSDRYEIGSEDLDELLRENNEKSAAEGEKEADLQSTEGRYISSETLSLVQESASEPADSNIMVVREETPSEGLEIVPIQVFVPVSQTTTVPEFEETPETDFEPTPLLQIEGTTKTYPAAEDAVALMMMARTASYVPKTDPMPSFSLDLTDSSQEEAATQEGVSTQEADRAKTPETANLLEQLEDLNTGDMKEKCYIWVTRVKTYADGKTNEFDNVCTLIAQDKYILSRMHLASLEAGSYIEAEIVSAMCLILNQKNDKRFREQVYCLSPDIVNMAVSKHPNGEFISPKTNKEFRVEDYPMFIPFIDAKKLTSHQYIFAPVCYSGHWWLWVIDTTKRRFYILDPLHKKAPSNERKQLNKFTGYVISRIRAYAGWAPLKKKENELEIKATYVNISGQKSSYDCAIYVMKWLELIEPENIKRAKYEWDNWPQDEVDHYRVEYASQILFSEMNKERDQAIRASNAIRLSKPSSVLLSPFCQINSTDIETE
ncbi:hypothetical protein Ahy_B08g092613 [Arachis hypogaea]|uniref:Ubiquitin-like protease family profile domain-containing protein n=1 Tax=Arachis hypogaea TaxID=3818 RepID=A0A444Y482_ARAHY|nr:hypothetical protein Ahy_B08g092613 [Arachis hypogaea]